MRYTHISTRCGCAMPGLAKAAARGIALAKAEAQGETPGRRKPQQTVLGKYVDSKAPALTRKLRKVLKKHRTAIAEQAAKAYAEVLRKDDGAAALVLEILERLGIDDLGEDIVDELQGAMLAAFRRAAEVGATQVGLSIEDITAQMDPAAHAYALKRGGELIKDLAGTTGDDLRAVLARGVEEGMSVASLQKTIEGLASFGEARAEMIARTELAFAHVQGNVAAWRESGEVVGKRWLLADTHDEPDECDQAAEAGIVGLDDEFVPGIMFPPDPHPRCCCDVEPILRELPSSDPADDTTTPAPEEAEA